MSGEVKVVKRSKLNSIRIFEINLGGRSVEIVVEDQKKLTKKKLKS